MDEAARAELEDVEVRIREIRLEMPRLGGLIAMIAVGGVGAVVSGYVALVAWVLREESRDDVYRDAADKRRDRNVILGLGAGTLMGLGVVAGGGAWLARRLRERREYKPELDVLRHRRRQLLQEVHHGFNGRGLSLTATF